MPEKHAVILFDGVCNLCNGFVQFVIARDRNAYFKFASLQSEEAKEYLKNSSYNLNELNSVILWENGNIYSRSTAALKILKRLTGGWPLIYSTIIIPPFIRNGVYDFIAGNRYKWFGKQDSCMLPTPELKSRFL